MCLYLSPRHHRASTLSPCHLTDFLGDPHRDDYRELTMHDVQFLCDRFGLTVKQVRDRLTTLSPTITGQIRQGKRGAKVLTDAGLAIFDRLIELERGGLSVSASVEQIQEERSEVDSSPLSSSVSEEGVSGDPTVISLLVQQNEDLRLERDRLLGLLENQSVQLQAMLPGSTEEDQKSKRSRWHHLKSVITGG